MGLGFGRGACRGAANPLCFAGWRGWRGWRGLLPHTLSRASTPAILTLYPHPSPHPRPSHHQLFPPHRYPHPLSSPAILTPRPSHTAAGRRAVVCSVPPPLSSPLSSPPTLTPLLLVVLPRLYPHRYPHPYPHGYPHPPALTPPLPVAAPLCHPSPPPSSPGPHHRTGAGHRAVVSFVPASVLTAILTAIHHYPHPYPHPPSLITSAGRHGVVSPHRYPTPILTPWPSPPVLVVAPSCHSSPPRSAPLSSPLS